MNRHEQVLALFRMCHCDDVFCDECPNSTEAIIKCIDVHQYIFDMCGRLIEENTALKADMQKMAETRSDCAVCDHFINAGNKPGCELNGWHCDWRWRGIEKFKADMAGERDINKGF